MGSRGERTVGGEGPFLFFGGEGGYLLVRVVLVISPSGALPDAAGGPAAGV